MPGAIILQQPDYMKTSFFTFLLTLVAFVASAQPVVNETRYVDSLLQLEKNGANDSIRACASFQLSDFWSYSDTARSRQHLELGKRLAGQNGYLQAMGTFFEAGFYFDLDYDRALALYEESANRFSQITTKESYVYQARAWRNMGAIYQRKDNESEMVHLIITKSIPLAEKAGETARVGSYYTDVGMIFMNIQEYGKAAVYFDKSFECYARSSPNMHDRLTTTLYAANNYCYMDSLAQAKIMIDRAGELLRPYPASEFNIDYHIAAIKYCHAAKAWEQGLFHARRGILLAEKMDKTYKSAELRFMQYKIQHDMGHYGEALETLQKAIDEIPVNLDGNRMLYFQSMAKTYEKMGNIPKAHEWLQRYSDERDSTYPEKMKTDIARIETKYNTAEKEKRIIQLQAEKQDALMTQKNQRLWNGLLGVAGLLLLVATLSLIVFYRTSKKQARQQVKEIEQRQELKVANALLEGEEKERRRLARDLHDGLGGSLAGIRIKLAGQQKKQVNGQLDEVMYLLEDSMSELRRIAHNMMPESLLKVGLRSAITDLCDGLANEELEIEFQWSGPGGDLPHTAQANIYRIVQEVLSNAIRHGRASKILLQCIHEEHMFYITAEDNGRGFDMNAAAGGIGLSNIRSRVQYMKGRLDIDSSPGAGTAVNIELQV